MALISIVLPVYNGALYLRESIESALAQTHENWQLIIVDDGSQDDSVPIARFYAQNDARIELVEHPHNRGLPAALNSGFAVARGEYHSWTSDDNCYHATALSEMLAAFEAHPDADIVYAGYRVIDCSGAALRQVLPERSEQLWKGNSIGACFLQRGEIFTALGGFREDASLAEDYAFWLDAAIAGYRFVPLSAILYDYRDHPASLTNQKQSSITAAHNRLLVGALPRVTWVSGARRCFFLLARFYRQRALWQWSLLKAAWQCHWLLCLCITAPALGIRLLPDALYRRLRDAPTSLLVKDKRAADAR